LKNAPLISIIIPTRNQVTLVKQCLQSILERSKYRNFELIVVDNRSDDPLLFDYLQSLSLLKDISIQTIKADFDFNFSALMNLGVQHSSGDLVLLLNNDVEVITADWLEHMAVYAQHESAGAVGVKLLYPDNSIQHAGIVMTKGDISRHVFVGVPATDLRVNTPRNFMAVTAACLMVSRKKFDEIGGFDTKFEVEFNDIDFCIRLFEKGYANIYLPAVELYHYESASRRHPHSDKKSFTRHQKEVELMRQRWKKYIDPPSR
jgi:O-antigen biosynthesis protein